MQTVALRDGMCHIQLSLALAAHHAGKQVGSRVSDQCNQIGFASVEVITMVTGHQGLKPFWSK